jgi:aspartyl-tRNA synthetase
LFLVFRYIEIRIIGKQQKTVTKKDKAMTQQELVVREKFVDMDTPGFMAEFTPDEADEAGFFVEDALSQEDALAAAMDGGEYVSGD